MTRPRLRLLTMPTAIAARRSAKVVGIAVSDPSLSLSLDRDAPGADSHTRPLTLSCAIVEIGLTAFFMYVIIGATNDRQTHGLRADRIGLRLLTLIPPVGIPVTNTSTTWRGHSVCLVRRRRRRPICGCSSGHRSSVRR